MACKKTDSDKLLKALRSKLKLSEPEKPDRFLGCYLTRKEIAAKDVSRFLQNSPDLHVRKDKSTKSDDGATSPGDGEPIP